MSSWTAKLGALAIRARSLRALESKDFRSFILGQGVSAVGTGMQQMALAWFVYRLTHSAWALAAMAAMLLAGQVLLSFVGGCLADKYDRRKLLIILQWSGAALALVVVSFILLKILSLPVLLLLALFLGSFMSLEYTARQSLCRELVSQDNLLSARGLYACVWSSSIALGQAGAGILVDLFPAHGEAICATLNAVSYIVSLLILTNISAFRSSANLDPAASGNNGNDDKNEKSKAAIVELSNKECLSFALRSETIFITFAQTMILVLFGLRYVSLLPAFAAELFNGGAKESGILAATVALGFSLGAIFSGGFRQKEKIEISADLSLLMLPLGLFVFCLSSNIYGALLSVLVLAVCQSININSCICLLQLSAPDRLFGRLMGLRMMLIAFCDLVAALVITLIVQQFGLRATVMTGAFIGFICTIILFSRRALASGTSRQPAFLPVAAQAPNNQGR